MGRLAYTAYAQSLLVSTEDRVFQTVMRRWDELDPAIKQAWNDAALAILNRNGSRKKKKKIRK